MRSTKVLFFFLLVVLLGVGSTFAAQDVSLELGKKLFSDPESGNKRKIMQYLPP